MTGFPAHIHTSVSRFGQTVIQDCTHCKTTDQYALFALPGPALQYILEAVLVALLTVERNGRTRWRTIGIVAVGAAALGEAYLALTVKISLPRNGRRVIMVRTARPSHSCAYLKI